MDIKPDIIDIIGDAPPEYGVWSVEALVDTVRRLKMHNTRLVAERDMAYSYVEDWRLGPGSTDLAPTGNHLIDRLRGIYTIPIKDGLGPIDGKNEFERRFTVAPIHFEAAQRIEELTKLINDTVEEVKLADSYSMTGPGSYIKTLRDLIQRVSRAKIT